MTGADPSLSDTSGDGSGLRPAGAWTAGRVGTVAWAFIGVVLAAAIVMIVVSLVVVLTHAG